MKKETKELLRLFGVALMVMMVVPLAYRVVIHFWPPEERPRQTLAQLRNGADNARTDRVEALRQQFASGSYNVDAQTLAADMLAMRY